VTSTSVELLLDLPDGANGGSGLIDSSLWGKIFLRLLLTTAAPPCLLSLTSCPPPRETFDFWHHEISNKAKEKQSFKNVPNEKYVCLNTRIFLPNIYVQGSSRQQLKAIFLRAYRWHKKEMQMFFKKDNQVTFKAGLSNIKVRNQSSVFYSLQLFLAWNFMHYV
jgi:hypothetical protein